MNLASFDLNLLVAFDALMDERNVTRAGQKIGLSQPAMSAVLKRLRTVTQDDLFERSGDGMRPTARAVELAEPIRQALQQIQATLDPGPFDPTLAKRTFRIATNDLGAALILPPLCEKLKSWSDGINFEFLYVEGDRAIELLQSGNADVAMGPYNNKYDQLHSALLYEAPFACALRNDHPLANETMTLETFARTPQIVVSQRGDPAPTIDDLLAKAGLKRRIAFTMPHYLAVPFLLARTDLIAVIPTKLVERFGATEKIRIADAPFSRLTIQTTLLWTHGANNNSANKWLRDEIIKLTKDHQLDHWRKE
jgi:DNA-binding transcriptional LysR family regulator